MIEQDVNKEEFKERLKSDINVYESVFQWRLNVHGFGYEYQVMKNTVAIQLL